MLYVICYTMRLNARQMREVEESEVSDKLKMIKRHPIYFILENIYDTYNVGGLFRLADAITAEKIYLCGQTEIPPNSKIKKASIGTYKVVNWQYCGTAKEAVEEIRKKERVLKQVRKMEMEAGQRKSTSVNQLPNQFPNPNPISIIAVEQHPKAISYTKAFYNFPLALIFGNETSGILPETLSLADQIVEIPMWGINKSLNVIVSAAIVSYFIMDKLTDR